MVKSTQIARIDGILPQSKKFNNLPKLTIAPGLMLAASVDDEQVRPVLILKRIFRLFFHPRNC